MDEKNVGDKLIPLGTTAEEVFLFFLGICEILGSPRPHSAHCGKPLKMLREMHSGLRLMTLDREMGGAWMREKSTQALPSVNSVCRPQS